MAPSSTRRMLVLLAVVMLIATVASYEYNNNHPKGHAKGHTYHGNGKGVGRYNHDHGDSPATYHPKGNKGYNHGDSPSSYHPKGYHKGYNHGYYDKGEGEGQFD